MKKVKLVRGASLLTAGVLVLTTISFASVPEAGTNLEESSISAQEFAMPSGQYRPGVRWWWPGGAAKTEDLIAQIEYLAENNFGAVEINAFNNGYVLQEAAQADIQNIMNYDTPEYYEKLSAVTAAAQENGIIVDLNIGSGYCANDDSVLQENTMGNMGLGRTTLSVSDEEAGTELTMNVPPVEVSALYLTELIPFIYNYVESDGLMGTWTGDNATLEAVIISKIVSKEGPEIIASESGGLEADTEEAAAAPLNFYDPDTMEVTKSYTNQYILDPDTTVVLSVNDIQDGKITFTPEEAGEYEVIGLYNEDSNSVGHMDLHYNADKRNYVVDHLDPEAIAVYVKDWIEGNEEYPSDLHTITEEYDETIRAAFNDSYEFHNDNYYGETIFEAAASEDNILGYDFTKYLPVMYEIGSANFILGLTMNMQNPAIQYQTTANNPLTYDLTEDEIARLTYDYQQLISQAFLSGMESFHTALAEYGLAYRQQAYNPPLDTLTAAKYVDIPETEGLEELSLKRVTSGAHVYGKDLITSEVFTLGTTPYTASPAFIKEGYDLMATAGVSNFFYHGLSATYYGTEEQQEAGTWGEEGWRAWPDVGVEMNETETLSDYYKTMNLYAARNNYILQSGSQSADVAIYMPLFGWLVENDTIRTLNREGYLYDVVGDDAIQNEFSVADGRITAASSGIAYDALIVDKQTLPVATMEHLKKLAEQGANILFVGELPDSQPGYMGGAYAEGDAQVKAAAEEMVALGAVQITDMQELTSVLAEKVHPEITYASNEMIRMNRRTLESGGEVAFIRNLNQTETNTVEIRFADGLVNGYLLDQNTGRIYKTDITSGTMTLNLKADAMVIVLAETQDYGYESAEDGLPESVESPEASESIALTDFTLTVTADNIGSNIPTGEIQTRVYEENVLGDWYSDDFMGGELKYVSDEGVYTTTFTIDDIAAYQDGTKSMILDLGEVKFASEIFVNGQSLGQLYYAPFEREITSALTEGENTLEIHVQPLRTQRRSGMKEAYEADPEGNAGLEYYGKTVVVGLGDASLTPGSGLIGPVVLNIID